MSSNTILKEQDQNCSNFRRIIPATEWNKYHTWPPIGGLRHLIFNEKINGFDKVIKRVGKRVLIDEAAFFIWIEEQNKRQMEGAKND